MKTVCEVLNVARSNIAVRTKAPLAKPLGRPPQPEGDLLDEIKAVIGEMPTYGYRRVWAVLRRAAKTQGLQPPNHKRVYRVMVGLDLRGAIVLREKVSRGRIASRLANLQPCLIGIEAGMATHYVARELAALGHDVKQVPPTYAKPFRQGHKNDFRDAQRLHPNVLAAALANKLARIAWTMLAH